MKFKLAFLFILCLAVFQLFAETVPHTIQWKGIETWRDGNGRKTVIAFENAHYPDNSLPYYVEKISYSKNFQYDIKVSNPELISASSEEEALLQNYSVPEEIKIDKIIANAANESFMFIQILPFVKKDGKYLKLKNFNLQIDKQQEASKVKTEANVRTYAENSVLANGKFIKVKIVDSGIYKLTYETLKSMGITPENVRVFGYGGALLNQDFTKPKPDDLPEVSVYMNKGSDNVFNAGDYILFYGKGIVDWRYDVTKNMFTHTLNNYAKEGFYFITSVAGVGKTINDVTLQTPADAIISDVTQFVDYQLHEKESINLIKSGKKFYGESFSEVVDQSFLFNFPNTIQSNSVKVRINAMATNITSSSFNVNLNGNQNQSFVISAIPADNLELGKETEALFTFTPVSDNLSVNMKYNKPTGGGKAYLDYVEVNAQRQLKMIGSTMFFRNVENYATPIYNHYKISGANNNVQIWDVTNPVNPQRITASNVNGTLEFTDSNEQLKQYLAIDPTAAADFPQPVTVGEVANQNLHAMKNVDYVILTHPRFLKQSNILADAHRTKDNLSVQVVTTEQVYNEFSSGTPDASAYRWMMKMLYDRSKMSLSTAPKYLLLFGRGSYDNRNILTSSSESLVLTYQADNSLHKTDSYVTDDYFGLLDDNEGVDVKSGLLDVGIGRFPVLTEQHATYVVNKTISYMDNTHKGIWKNQLCFVGDDGGEHNGVLHMNQSDTIAEFLSRTNKGYQANKIFLDAFKQEVSASGERYPLARTKLHNLIHSGLFLLNYSGHAGEFGWSNEQILTTDDIKKLYNQELPVWIAATCDFVWYDAPLISAGEYVLLNPVGGGNSIFAAARTVYAAPNVKLNKTYVDNLFKKRNGNYSRLGDAVMYGKNDIPSEINKLSFVLLGDPALKPNFPTDYNVVTEKINNIPISSNDTLKALSVDSIQGTIKDLNGNKMTDYSGILEINVYDKKQKITTLDNHGEGAYTYFDRPNLLYSGKTYVKNGEFNFKLMMPKDIRYNYGTGRINYYVNDTVTQAREGQGYYERLYIGGSSKNFDAETDGPEVNMYLNSSSFRNGDKVNETPMFYAFLSDKNGINTVGSGIGHDLRLTIDNDYFSTYILNDAYESVINDYTRGMVKFKIPTLKAGKHTLTFQAWDLLNNSTTKTLNFEVVPGLQPTIFKVVNYPNPANVVTKTKFNVIHDRPESVLDVMIEIFDLQGRKIWTKTDKYTNTLEWNLTDGMGKTVQAGVYLYKLSIKSLESEWTSVTGKIIVTK